MLKRFQSRRASSSSSRSPTIGREPHRQQLTMIMDHGGQNVAGGVSSYTSSSYSNLTGSPEGTAGSSGTGPWPCSICALIRTNIRKQNRSGEDSSRLLMSNFRYGSPISRWVDSPSSSTGWMRSCYPPITCRQGRKSGRWHCLLCSMFVSG